MAPRFPITPAALAQNDLMEAINHLPIEVRDQIRQYLGVAPRQIRRLRVSRVSSNMSTDPSIAPRNGSCPLLKLSVEERRHILQEFLPSKDRIIQPPNEGNPESRTCDLLLLNKQLCSELSTVLYEERTFAINVYEGLFTGGVEFLNSGLQRLQYKNAFTSNVFKRFEKEQQLFGFQRLKRLHIVIHPSKDELSKANRHDPLLTYFMLCTMLGLLKKKDGASELNYLKIVFAENDAADAMFTSGRNAIMRASQYWWNPDVESPRETSIHGVSNVELILSAFECLNKVHKVDVELPKAMKFHDKTIKSVNRLAERLDPKRDMMDTCEHDLGHKLEVAREALDEFIFRAKFGNKAIRDPDVWIDLSEPVGESHFALDRENIDDLNEDEQFKRAIRASLAELEEENRVADEGKATMKAENAGLPADNDRVSLKLDELPALRRSTRIKYSSHSSRLSLGGYVVHENNSGARNVSMNGAKTHSDKATRVMGHAGSSSKVTGNERNYELPTLAIGSSAPPVMSQSYSSIFGGPVGIDGNGAGNISHNNAKSSHDRVVRSTGHAGPSFSAGNLRTDPFIQSQQSDPFLTTSTMGLPAPGFMPGSQTSIFGGPVGEINGNGIGHVSTNDVEYLPSATRRTTENVDRSFPDKLVGRRDASNGPPMQHQQPGPSSPTYAENSPQVALFVSPIVSHRGLGVRHTNEGAGHASRTDNVRESDAESSFLPHAKAPRIEEDDPMPDA